MRLRLLKTLGGPGKRFLHDSKQLKYILCPVVAKSPAEQIKFYELFDRFHKDVLSAEVDIVIPEKKPFWESMPKWLMWVIITLPVALLIGYGIYKVSTAVPVPPRGIQVQQFSAPVGDTITFNNIAPPEDTLSKNMHWSLVDNESDQIELEEHESFHWQMVVPDPGTNPRKTVRLIYEDINSGVLDTFTTDFLIECLGGIPQINNRDIPANGTPGSELTFAISVPGQDSLSITWDFGDDSETAQGARVNHTYDTVGNYQVKVTIRNENAIGFCETDRRFGVSIGQEKAYLFFKVLHPDTMEPMASFSWATWILMSLLALAIVYYWVRWFARKAPEPEQNEKEKDPVPDHFKSSDKAPYLIPFRSRNDFIQVDPQLFRFADTMRSRQEGLRRSLDVPGSVKATIEGGGFPRLLEKRDTQPTEYLFLIDEQSMHSHQAKLFDYLINFLKEKDVLLETFYYNTDLNRFWNKYYPKGIRDVMLPRLYQHHRLVILGDAHGLLDPYGNKSGQLRESAIQLLKTWKERLLITPLPPTSWTWKEEALHSLFPVFPADVLGLGQAMSYIERGEAEDEYQPDFETWKEGLLADRDESDVNRRRWHRLKEYKAFLKDYPDVYKWLCALSVCPQVNWETTIAIGQALKPLGVEVTFDKLLLLARVPFLQTGILSGRLRLEMMQELDEETEALAREAIQRELEAIRAKVKDGHANFELNSQLAVQRFALDPKNKDHQSDIRFLLNNGLLDKRQVSELEKAITKESQLVQEQNIQQSFLSKMAPPPPPSLDEYLAEQEELPEPPKKPFVTPDFVKAISATGLFIVLFIAIWTLDGTDRLYQMAFGPEKTAKEVGDESQLRNLYYFVQETFPIDSAKFLNNNSVSIYNNLITRELTKETQGDTSFLDDILPTADRGFQRALSYDPEYTLARENRSKMWYSVGTVLYNSKLENYSFTSEDYSRFHGYFNRALSEGATRLDALHGKGLLHYYEGNPDSALFNYNQILDESDSLFFDTLSHFPHLRYLLYKDIQDTTTAVSPEEQEALSRGQEVRLDFFVFDAPGDILFQGNVRVFEVNTRGATRLVEEVAITGDNNPVTVTMEFGKQYRLIATSPGYDSETKNIGLSAAFLKAAEGGPNNLNSFYLEPVIDPFPGSSPMALYFDHQAPADDGEGRGIDYFLGVLGDYYERKEDYKEILAAGLNQEDLRIMERLVDQFFDQEVRDAIAEWENTLDGLADFLERGEQLTFILDAYDDPFGSRVESKLISERRIRFMVNMMYAYGNGVLIPYVNSGQLTIVETAKGETESRKDISDNIGDPRNSIYEMGPMFERRVEIRIENQPGTSEELTPLQREIRDILVDKLGLEENEVVPNARLTYDLGADELDIVEIIMEIERKFDIQISDRVAENIATVQDFYDVVGLTLEAGSDSLEQSGIIDENNVVLLTDAASLARGKEIFEANCAACHGTKGGGAVGPNHTDNYWIHGGSIQDVFKTIKYGVQEKGMISWQNQLRPEDIQKVASYVLSLQGTNPPNAKAPEGEFYNPSAVEQNQPPFREPEMVFVQGGTFQMGCVDDKERGIICDGDEKPVHEVELDDFYIGKYEVTQEEWVAVMGNNPSQSDNCLKCPVENVNWSDVQEFISRLNERTGKKYRLPTEAEWEYAARGGQKGGSDYIYSGSNNLDEVGWYNDNSNGKTHIVGQKNPNALGLFDMSGNVWELCNDFFDESFYRNSPKINPTGPYEGSRHVARGGGWLYDSRDCRSVRRGAWGENVGQYLGFRLALKL
ncbi:MAG: acyl carrier protein [Bacteroidetes bacterium]|nr:MAG: acyl carrier protein [Bacteroidota bacterium]